MSDGTDSPEDIFKNAKRLGIDIVSITDHDTISALRDAEIIAEEMNMELVPGVELSCEYYGEEVHILGYYIEFKNEELEEELKWYQKKRVERVKKILDKLQQVGIHLTMEDVIEFSQGESMGRMHVARALIKRGYASDIKEVFARFLSKNGIAYVPKPRLSIEEAIGFIKKYKGVPVLAHPGMYKRKDEIINFAIKKGIEGIEVWYPEHPTQLTERLHEIVLKNDLVPTGGSDHHGKPKELLGSIMIDEKYVRMLARRSQYEFC